MSTPTPSPGNTPPAPVAPHVPPRPQERKLVIYSHSNLFYWWPVWVVGFLMTIISFFGDRMVMVPAGTEAPKLRVTVVGYEQPHHVLVLPNSTKEQKANAKEQKDEEVKKYEPHFMRVSHSKSVGVFFVVVLLLVIAITNIPLRGWLSFVVIIVVFFVTVILSITHSWDFIFDWLDWLDIRMNMACYLVITVVLFTLWLLGFFFIDRQECLIFEPGEVQHWHAIGEGNEAFGAAGTVISKQRSDLFRHWVLGFGSGDLTVHTLGGAGPRTIVFNNVLFVGRKEREANELLRAAAVVAGNQNMGTGN